ncbi:MAG TPA: MazG family protein, partial [Candidatus Sphingobacterium stercoripullorum]|nr:MazG family protein [Candidatus Sphingobacterium stercoripullorum]
KLILRHPHIYGDVDAKNEEAVKKNWEKIKLKEGNKSVLAGVPNGLPALVKAYRIQEKVKGVGFDWPDSQQVWDKVEEELGEFKEAYLAPTKESINMQEAEAEFGDLLFSLVNYGRHIGINPENALERTNKKFIGRFKFMEEKAKQANEQLGDLNLEQLDSYWNEAKRENRTEK